MIVKKLKDSTDDLEKEKNEYFKTMAPLVIFGGQAFKHDPEAARQLGGRCLGNDALSVVEQLADMIKKVKV